MGWTSYFKPIVHSKLAALEFKEEKACATEENCLFVGSILHLSVQICLCNVSNDQRCM